MAESIELAVRAPTPPTPLHLAAASTSTLRLPSDLPTTLPKEDTASVLTLTPDTPAYDCEAPKYESSLAPVDGGFAAWSLVRLSDALGRVVDATC